MAVLVTGGCGYIGSHMVWALCDRGLPVVALDDLSTGFAWAIPPKAELVTGDVGDEALLDKILSTRDIDSIFHFAASSVVPESVANPLGTYLNNSVKSRALAAAAVRHGVKHMVFSSTAAVYGTTGMAPVGEDDALAPQSPYGWSKLMTETMLADIARAHDFHYAALRYFNVAGADPDGRVGQSTLNATHLIKVACETALGLRPEIQVFGTDYETPDGTGVRDYIHVTDLVEAHLKVMDHLRQHQTSLVANCGYGHGYSVLDILKAVERASGVSLAVRFAARRPGDPASAVANADRLRRTVGWQPRWNDLDAIVAHALAWEKGRIGRSAEHA